MQQTLHISDKQTVIVDQEQYSLPKILGLWALVALPMFLLAWVIAPALIPYSPFHEGITFWLLIIAGMIWQFVLSSIILYRELDTVSWKTIRERLWLTTPQNPKTGKREGRLFWWIIPAFLLSGLLVFSSELLDAPWVSLFPFLEPNSFMDISQLATPEFQGAWSLLGIVLLNNIFNYFLGEEFFFHGILLPKMKGVFGKWDWVANGVLYGLYHLHKPWAIPGIIASCIGFALPSRYFRSNWFAIILHGFEGIVLFVIVFGIISGIAG